jgi:glycosyltransferase involved in cell wall biosynthesis
MGPDAAGDGVPDQGAIVEDHARMRALIVTSMWPSPGAPARGSFVRDQADALRARGDVDVDVFAFPPKAYLRAARDIRARFRSTRFDVVHAHFGLTAWPALAAPARTRAVTLHGTDVRHPRSRLITHAALGRYDLVAAVSEELARDVPGAARGRRVAVLPCGVALDRFRPLPRAEARARLGLPAGARALLLPADPARPVKRADRARDLAAAAGAQLLTLGSVPPDEVPYYVNAADAVVVPSDHEGFGLAALEALACDVPVVATPVGNHPAALDGIAGTLCAPYDRDVWLAALRPHLETADARVAGRRRAALWSADRMAARVVAAWAELVGAVLPSRAEAPTGAVRT